MKKYHYKFKMYFVSILGLLLNSLLFILIEDIIIRVFLIGGIGLSVVNFINYSLTYYELTSSNLILKSAFKEIIIGIADIEYIGLQPAGWFVRESICIVSAKSKISITALSKDHRKLVSSIIDSIPNIENVQIDEYVTRIIE